MSPIVLTVGEPCFAGRLQANVTVLLLHANPGFSCSHYKLLDQQQVEPKSQHYNDSGMFRLPAIATTGMLIMLLLPHAAAYCQLVNDHPELLAVHGQMCEGQK